MKKLTVILIMFAIVSTSLFSQGLGFGLSVNQYYMEDDNGDAIDNIKQLKEQVGGIHEYLQMENNASIYDFEKALNSLKKLITVITKNE